MKSYTKTLGIFRNAAIEDEINRLDPVPDHQRIVHLLTCYEFPFDMVRSLELALFHTYASPSVSGLLERTGEFSRRGQKRYDDTSILIAQFMQAGYDSDLGQRAISQMNRIHGSYRIPNEDFLFVLATFIFYPIDWMDKYGWRKLKLNEQQAIFLFFRAVGIRMNLQDMPATLEDFKQFTEGYENRHFRFVPSNRVIADATVKIVENWFPNFLRPAVEPAFVALISDKLRQAFGYQRPAGWFCSMVNGSLQVRKWFLRYITFKKYPTNVANTHWRTYPTKEFSLETLGPGAILKRIDK